MDLPKTRTTTRYNRLAGVSLHISRRVLLGALLSAPILQRLRPAHAAGTIRCVFGDSYPPWSWGSDTAVQGLAPDLVTALLQDVLGHAIDKAGYPWKRAQEEVVKGAADVLCTVATEERQFYTIASIEPIFTAGIRIYVSKKSPLAAVLTKATSLAEIQALRPFFVTYLGSSWSREMLAGSRFIDARDLDGCLRVVAAGRVDAMLDSDMVLRHRRKAMGLEGDILRGKASLASSEFRVLIGRQSPHQALMTTIDAQMPAFKASPVYRQLLARYDIAD